MIRFHRSFRAISPVLAVLMMIAVAIAGSLVVYAWVMGYIGLSTGKSGQQIVIQSVDNQGTDLLVYVQNVGECVVQLDEADCLYVGGRLVRCGITGVIVSDGTATLGEGETATIRYFGGAAPPGQKAEVKVTTTLGVSAEYNDYPAGTGSPIPGSIRWSKTYGGTGTDRAYSLVVTSDGGYAIAGSTTSFGAGEEDFWLFKTDEFGYVEWNRTYGGIGSDIAYSLVATSDGGYALAGVTYSFGGGWRNFWLVKTDSSGNLEWNQTYSGTGNEAAYSVVEATDGGYAIAGYTSPYGIGGNIDILLVKTDSAGNMEWNRTYGGPESDSFSSLAATVDGGYALLAERWISESDGDNQSFPTGSNDCWLVKTDEFGNIMWNQTYTMTAFSSEPLTSLVATSDGGCAMVCPRFSVNSTGVGLIKLDASGNVEWNQTYNIPRDDFFVFSHVPSVVVTSDGGYAITGYSYPFGDVGGDVCLVKTDKFGNLEWTQTYDGIGETRMYSVVEAPDSGYAIAGTKDGDFWLIKTY